jgi:hypothetical protein
VIDSLLFIGSFVDALERIDSIGLGKVRRELLG